jgi:amidophosphoribosyltransferase
MPNKKDLISANLNIKELTAFLKVDTLDFLTTENLIKILKSENHCFGCFTGEYPVKRNEIKEEVWQKKINL